ncbi:MAG: hypothetical protein LLF75_07110 [Eubacteriales bacterium]|nr:hypothetical protein [Eubacteriales bacterium]
MKRTIIRILTMLMLAAFASACAAGAAPASPSSAPAATAAPAETAEAAAANPPAQTDGSAQSGALELTLSELAQFNGKDGNPAYVAVDGVIYDVTNLPKWKNGEHNGYSAGQDLTDIIKNKSPHGVAKLKDVPVVGKLIEG